MADLFSAVFGPKAGAALDKGLPLRRFRHRDASFTVDAPDEIGMVLTLSEAHRVERRLAGRTSTEAPRVGATTLLLPGNPARFTITGPARILMLRLPWSKFGGWLAEDHDVDPDRLELRPKLHADDPALARLIYRATALRQDDLEEIGRFIAARLLAEHAAQLPPAIAVPSQGGLSPVRLRRVLDRIEVDLPGPLSLSMLAGEAGTSPFHFAREFQRATGVSPHQYLIRRRVDRAFLLLACRRTTVAEVARGVGFAHASHLARHMRRLTGLTPEVFRTDVLP